MKSPVSFRRLYALCRKETWQILRDPSSNLIAFVLPVVMLFIFGYGINLDSTAVNIGLVLEDASPEARHFADNLYGSRYFVVHPAETQAEIGQALTEGRVRGFVVVPADFAEKLERPTGTAPLLVVTDGSEPNTANFVQNYVTGAWNGWIQQRAGERGEAPPPGITIEPRFWFNPAAESRNFLIPGSITIIMTVIGALLTSLVVAREWERGTMEALLASPVTRTELLLSKLLPYYVLGIVSLFLCVGVAALMMQVPFRGSLLILWGIGSLFLASSLGLGLLLSTVLRNQFVAAQAALNAAFLPALMLSGFLFEIRSMPAVIQAATYLIPARYFVTAIQTLFQAGNVPPILLHSGLFLVAAGSFFIGLTALKTRRRLE
ncbi:MULTISPECIES: ABC transporter permease [Methylomicrobium]|uniref:ABC-type multidrug transport system, permease component n=1 Tax=Methylomicrobium album BG8 TaxID=686340 RepID=H8GGJ3_METAL|nr:MULTISPECIES: ABC transporter permease [Methylomicrobium]EIC28789.1 ABC-type multidrug transport system, permease component [Methylomicrobium album BG8]